MNVYCIKKSSELGKQFAAYIEKCNEVEQRAKDFVLNLNQWLPGLFCTEHTKYENPADSEAGGVLYISVLPDVYDVYAEQVDRQVWETYRDRDYVNLFPRIVTETHFIRYDRAVKLHNGRVPEWKFQLDNAGNVAFTTYEQIRRRISANDRRALCGKRPDPKSTLKVAFGRRYFFVKEEEDSIQPNPTPAPLKDSRPFADAVAVYDAFNSLPIVPIGTGARLLQLHLPNDKQHISRKEIQKFYCQLSWEQTPNEYVIRTPLISDHRDMEQCV